MDAAEKAIKLAGALNCTVNYGRITFDRKNYFYHDLPRGYQITQHFHPLGRNGHIVLSNGRKIGIRQVHLEEDTAQQFRNENSISLNFSRLGRALAEVVTEPDFRSYGEVEDFLRFFRRVCRFNGLSEAAYEAGEMRVDINISIRSREEDPLNPKSEIKNINSLHSINKSIDYLIGLQSEALARGAPMESFTYSWSEKLNGCEMMRRKGSSFDYFYVPEANIPIFSIPDGRYRELMEDLIVDFGALSEKLRDGGLKAAEVEFLLDNHRVFGFVSRLNSHLGNPASAYNWMVNVISGMVENLDWDSLPYEEIERTILEVEKEGKISMKIAKSIFREILESGISLEQAKRKLNVSPITDVREIRRLVEEAFEQYGDQMAKLRENPTRLEKLIIGECMKKSRGQADPAIVKSIFDEVFGSWV